MDGPLYDIKDRHVDDIDISDIDEDDEYYYYKRIDHALGQDNKDVFVQLINSMPSVELDDQLDEIHSSAFFWDAADCVAAALAGETKIPNVYAWLARGTSPMHQAASSAATRITALLLEKGLSADAICDGDPPHSGDVLVLPLCILLSKFSRLLVLHSRRPRPSAVQIIVELFGLKGTLETLRLFAQNSREVKNVLFNSLKEGKVVEVGALLLVARCRLLSSSTAEEESDLGFRSISEMHDFLLHAKRSLCAGGSSTESNFKGKLIEMEETLLLLKIFDKIGDKLATLIRLNFAQTGLHNVIEKLIRDDNKVEFTSFLESDGRHACDFSPSQLLKLICMHRATGCATEFFDNKLSFCVDVNKPLEGGLLPLQIAAESLSSGVTSILLEHGAQANLCDERGLSDLAMLPLNIALQAISDRCVSNWSPDKSIYKLLYIFCLRDMKEPLETISLLAKKTEDIEKISLYHVEKGEVVQLAALLMASWDRLVPPDVEDVEKSVVGQCIWRQLAGVYNQELQCMINCGPNCQELELLTSKKINLLTEWKYLKVFEMARDVVEDYLDSPRCKEAGNCEVPFDIAYELYWFTDLILKPDDVYSDDIECLRPMLSTKQKDKLNESIEKQMQLWQHECKTRNVDKLEAGLQKESFGRPMVSSAAAVPSTGSGCCSLLSSTSLSSSRPYHTWADFNISFGKPVKSCETINIQKGEKPQLRVYSQSTKICARLLLCAKRVMK